MVELKVTRNWKKDTYTIGKFYVNGVYWCNTLEDKDRGLESSMSEMVITSRKRYGETAIPLGTYTVGLTYSSKFATRPWASKYNGRLPLLDNVKGFSGIRIHPGNTAKDTLGCLLLGENKTKGKVLNSTKWFYKLMDEVIIPAIKKGEKIVIRIEG